jgi:hypothetical protein
VAESSFERTLSFAGKRVPQEQPASSDSNGGIQGQGFLFGHDQVDLLNALGAVIPKCDEVADRNYALSLAHEMTVFSEKLFAVGKSDWIVLGVLRVCGGHCFAWRQRIVNLQTGR